MPERGGSVGHGPGAAELQGGPPPAFHGKTILVTGSGDVLAPMLAAEAARRGAAPASAADAAAAAAGCELLVDAFVARFGRIDAALAAWNAGEGAVRRAGNRVPDIDETQAHVHLVLELYWALLQQSQPARAQRVTLHP